jgi:hypothetical protein
MRREIYRKRLPSLLPMLDVHGQDPLDARSFSFAAWLGDRPVATIRATPYPFETLSHVDEERLARYLGPTFKDDYLEWGRLAAEPVATSRRIVPALITYAGLRLLLYTPYSKYFGYTRRRVRGVFNGFRVQDDTLTFQIPSRGDHQYLLLKGDMSLDLVHALPQWLASLRAIRRAVREEAALREARGRFDHHTGRTLVIARAGHRIGHDLIPEETKL